MLLLEKLYKLGTLFVEKVCEMLSTETKSTGQTLLGKDGYYCNRSKTSDRGFGMMCVRRESGKICSGGKVGGGRNPTNFDEASSQSVKSFERMCAGEIKAIKTNCF